jgi:hypothetical protein
VLFATISVVRVLISVAVTIAMRFAIECGIFSHISNKLCA